MEEDKKAITKLYQDLKREFFSGVSYENMFPSSPAKLIEEQKPTDKVEPKFKIGQIIKKEGFNTGFTIAKIEDDFYYNDEGDYFPFTDQDNWELVEEPKKCMFTKEEFTEEDRKILCEDCEERCAYGIVGSISTNARGKENIKEEPVSEDLESEIQRYYVDWDEHPQYVQTAQHFAKWQKKQMMAKAIDGKVLVNGMGNPILHLWNKGRHLIDKKVKIIVIKEY